MELFFQLLEKVKNKKAKIGIVGMGYVGQALADATTSVGFTTLGFDINEEKVAVINQIKGKLLSATKDTFRLSECDIICICVPTPIDKAKNPDLSVLEDVLTQISKNLRPGQLIIIESSVAAGTTRGFVLPILEKSNLKISQDFFLAYSPERIDPGNSQFDIRNTPKVVGGIDDNSKKLAVEFYGQFVEKVVLVSSVEVAEMSKVLENTFRFVNISLINEIAAFTKSAGIDIWQVIEAASTKPFGFLAHYPGPGVGGHCIPVLPYHLLASAKKQKVKLRIVETAAVVNEAQPKTVAKQAIEIVNGRLNKNGYTPKVLLIGVSYKPETANIRGSPALKIWEILESQGFSVSYHDPHVPAINGFSSKELTQKVLKTTDLIIITTAHKNIPYDKLLKSGKPIIDTRNALAGFANPNIPRV